MVCYIYFVGCLLVYNYRISFPVIGVNGFKGLDPDQAGHFVGPDLVTTVCRGKQQATNFVISRLKVKPMR